MSRSLLVVDPSLAWPETQGVAEVAALWGGPVHVWTPALDPATRPSGTVRDHAGVVLLGSRASVHDELAWRPGLDEFLVPALSNEAGRPFLGVCFGHQWLAHVAGGEVAFARPGRDKIVGVQRTKFEPGRWFRDGATLSVVVSHREVVTRVPAGYRPVASREDSRFDALEHVEAPVWSVQFHPEARDEFASNAGIDPATVDPRTIADSRRVLRAFLDAVPR